MTNLPVFFTSAEASVARESMILAHTPFLSDGCCNRALGHGLDHVLAALHGFHRGHSYKM